MSMLDAAGAKVAELAAEQWGLITTAQARELGVTPVQLSRLATRGALERAHHGIYRMTRIAHDPDEDLHLAWIATATGVTAEQRIAADHPGAVVSHESAARQLGLGDLPADVAELTTPRRVRLRLPDVRIYVDPTMDVDDWTLVNGLPVTTALRTITDLASEQIDGEHLGTIIRDALVRNLCDIDDVGEAIAPYAFTYGYALGKGREMVDELVATAGVSRNTMALSQAATKARTQLAYEDFLRRNPDALAGISSTARALQPPLAGVGGLHEAAKAIMASYQPPKGLQEAARAIAAAYQPAILNTEAMQGVLSMLGSLNTIDPALFGLAASPDLSAYWASQPVSEGILSTLGESGNRVPPAENDTETSDEVEPGD